MRYPLFVVSGPAACGKNELVVRVLEIFPELTRITTHSTRKPRRGEVPEKAYVYIPEQEFLKHKVEGQLSEFSLAHGHYHGTYNKDLFSMLEAGPGIIVRDPQGADKLYELFPNAHFIFILAPEHEIRDRLKVRSQNMAELTSRLQDVRQESLAAMHAQYDCIINNSAGKFDRSTRLLIRFLMETLG